MQIQLQCVAVIAAAVWLATTALAYSSGSGSGYDYANDNTDCVRPPGASSGVDPTRNIGSAQLKARCLAVCLQEQQVSKHVTIQGEILLHILHELFD